VTNLPEESYEKTEDSWYFGWGSNWATPKYKRLKLYLFSQSCTSSVRAVALQSELYLFCQRRRSLVRTVTL
jgi:hypothetical protein